MAIKGKWDKSGKSFVASVRLTTEQRAAGPESLTGQLAVLVSKAGDFSHVTLGKVVRDFGAGDVTLYKVER